MFNKLRESDKYSQELNEKVITFLDILIYSFLDHSVGLTMALLYWNENFAFMDFIDPSKPEAELTYKSVRENNIVFLSIFMNKMLADFFEDGATSPKYKAVKQFIEKMIFHADTEKFKKLF